MRLHSYSCQDTIEEKCYNERLSTNSALLWRKSLNRHTKSNRRMSSDERDLQWIPSISIGNGSFVDHSHRLATVCLMAFLCVDRIKSSSHHRRLVTAYFFCNQSSYYPENAWEAVAVAITLAFAFCPHINLQMLTGVRVELLDKGFKALANLIGIRRTHEEKNSGKVASLNLYCFCVIREVHE